MPNTHQNEVTSIICRNIKPGHEKDYDDWLERYLTSQRKATGYLGTTIIIPGGSKSSLRYIVHRFADKVAMERWEKSRGSLELLEEVNNYSERHYDTVTGYGNMVFSSLFESSNSVNSATQMENGYCCIYCCLHHYISIKIYSYSFHRPMAHMDY